MGSEYTWQVMLAYALMVAMGAGLLHWIGGHQVGSKTALAYYRRFLPDRARKDWSDAQLRDEVRAIHGAASGWSLDLLTVVTLVAAVLIAQQVTMGEPGVSGGLKYITILVLVAVPTAYVVHKIRSALYSRALRTRVASRVLASTTKSSKTKTKRKKRK